MPLNMVYLTASAREAGLEVHLYDAMTKGVGHSEIKKKTLKLMVMNPITHFLYVFIEA